MLKRWRASKSQPKNDNAEMEELIVDKQNGTANVGAVHQEEEKSLHTLCYLGRLEKIKECLARDNFSNDSLVRTKDEKGMTPVQNAALGGGLQKTEIVKMLLEHDLKDERSKSLDPLVNFLDDEGKTVLHYAALSNKADIIEDLLNNFGADPNITDTYGYTPLHICASNKENSDESVKCLQLLLNHEKTDRNKVCSADEMTLLHLAAGKMADKVVKCLLNNGFEPFTQDKKGLTPLMLACSAGDMPKAVSCVQQLLEKSNQEQVNAKSLKGNTATHIAAHKSHSKILELLVKNNNVDITICNKDNLTPLHMACQFWNRAKSLDCIKLLVESEKLSEERDKLTNIFGCFEKPDTANKSPFETVLENKAIHLVEYFMLAAPSPDVWMTNELLGKIYQILPEAMLPIMNRDGLKYNPIKFLQTPEVDAEFGFFTGFKESKDEHGELFRVETRNLQYVLNAPKETRAKFLQHPLVQIFLEKKWRKATRIHWLTLFVRFIWQLLYTFVIFEIYNISSANKKSSGINQEMEGPTVCHIWRIVTLQEKEGYVMSACRNTVLGSSAILLIFLLLVNISILVMWSWKIKKTHKIPKRILFQVLVILIVLINFIPIVSSKVDGWQITMAAIGMFLTWASFLSTFEMFPTFANNYAIIKKVLGTCFALLFYFSPLMVAFAFSLRLIMPHMRQYETWWSAIVKIITTLSGDLNYDGALYENADSDWLANVVYGLLAIVLVIVTNNILIGLAVSDTKALLKEAEIKQLRTKLKQVYFIDSLVAYTKENFEFLRGFEIFDHYKICFTSTPYGLVFSHKISEIHIKAFSSELEENIKHVMQPIEEDDTFF